MKRNIYLIRYMNIWSINTVRNEMKYIYLARNEIYIVRNEKSATIRPKFLICP